MNQRDQIHSTSILNLGELVNLFESNIMETIINFLHEIYVFIYKSMNEIQLEAFEKHLKYHYGHCLENCRLYHLQGHWE